MKIKSDIYHPINRIKEWSIKMKSDLKKSKKRISSKEFTQKYMSKESQDRIQALTDQLDLEYSLMLIRKELNKTQKEIAEILGISQPTLSGIENVTQDIKLSTMKKYIEALGGSMSININLPTGKTVSINV